MRTIKILGIDPGNNIGLSVGSFDLDDPKVLTVDHTEAHTLDRSSCEYATRHEFVSANMKRLLCLDRILMDLIPRYSVDGVACEEPYIHPQRPQAASAIVMYVTQIEYRLLTSFGIRLEKVHNMAAKKNLSVSSISKEGIREAVLNNSDIVFSKQIDKLGLVEHQYDSIGILWSYKQLLSGMY